MKSKLISFCLLFSFLLTACFEDKGNYVYSELEKIEIRNVQGEYARIYMRDRLQIVPEVKTSDSQGELVCCWTYQGTMDTIAKTAVLDTFVNWTPKTYNLLLNVTNKRTGYTIYQNVKFTVNTPFSIGWYVLKDDGDVADLDLYTDTAKIENVIQLVNGSSMQGIGEKISFFAKHDVFDAEKNTYTEKKVLFCTTDRDINGIDAITAQRWRVYEDCFFDQPAKRLPGALAEGLQGAYLINAGKAHAIELSSASNGKFGMQKHLKEDYDHYQLSKYMYVDGMKIQALVYDTVSCSFYMFSARSNALVAFEDENETEMSCLKTNKRLLYLGNKAIYFGKYAYAVFQDKINHDLKIMSRIRFVNKGQDMSKLEISNDTLKIGTPAFVAQHYTISHSEEVMYFTANNQVYSKNVASKKGTEIPEYTIPVGEKATFIKSLLLNKKNFAYNCNYLVLGTEINGTYKIRCFAKTTAGHLNPVPVLEFPRKDEVAHGRAADAIFVHPNIGAMTYIPTY